MPCSNREPQYWVVTDHATSPPAELNGFRIAAEYSPAYEVGGDFYCLSESGPHAVTVVIGDVCGRGAPAAELVRGLDPEIRRLTRAALPPAQLLGALNRFCCARLSDNAFVTAACLRLDGEIRSLIVANAGHVPPALRRSGGYSSLIGRPSGPPLGMLAGAWYQEEVSLLRRGDLVLLMTDGVLEAVEDDLITMRTVLGMLGRAPGEPRSLNRSIFEQVRQGLHRPDDLTLLSIKFGDDVPSSTRQERSSAGFERRLSGVS